MGNHLRYQRHDVNPDLSGRDDTNPSPAPMFRRQSDDELWRPFRTVDGVAAKVWPAGDDVLVTGVMAGRSSRFETPQVTGEVTPLLRSDQLNSPATRDAHRLQRLTAVQGSGS